MTFLTGFFFVAPSKALATKFPVNGIEITTDTEAGGKKDNLIRIVEGQTAPFSVLLTLSGLEEYETEASKNELVFNTDTLIFSVKVFDDRPILALGVNLNIRGEGNACRTSGLVDLPFITSADYLDCRCPSGMSQCVWGIGPNFGGVTSLRVGQTYRFNFTLNDDLIKKLMLERPCPAGGTGVNCFTVYPNILFRDAAGGTLQISVGNAAKDIYVQKFKTQAELDKAVAENIRPAGVPDYGSRTGRPTTSKSSSLLGLINKIIGIILGLIQELIFLIFFYLIAPLIQAVLSIRTYTDTFAAVIYPGWEVVRNLCNIIFIVALIAIAMATLFRIESYKFRELLVQLIIAALLVNFSLVIAQVVLGVADTVQNQFLPNNKEVIRALAKDLMVGYREVVYNMDFAAQGDFAYTLQPFFFLALSVGSFMVFLAIGAFLVIRIVMLWILLMISPIAYAVGVLPSTKHYRSEWWKNFLKYAFFTPIMAFFLNMAAVIVTTYKDNPVLKEVSGADFENSSVASFVFKVASNVLLLVFLLVGLKVAEQFGIYGASAVTGFARKGMMYPFALTGKGLKALQGTARRVYSGWVGGKIGEHAEAGQLAADKVKQAEIKAAAARQAGLTAEALEWEKKAKEARVEQAKHARRSAGFRVMSLLDPHVLKEAWKKREHEKEMRAYQPAIGHMEDTFNRIMPTEFLRPHRLAAGELGKKTYHGLVAKRGVVATEAKDLLEGVRTREDSARILENAFRSGDKDEIEAALKVVQSGNWQDDYMNINGETFSIVNYLNDITKRMKDAGFSEEEIIKILDDLKETGEKEGRIRAYGYTTMDKDGKVRRASDFEYFEKLSVPDQAKELRAIAAKFNEEAMATGEVEFQDAANKFNDAANQVAAGTISWQEAMQQGYYDPANSAFYQDRPDKEGNTTLTLANALTQRRFMDEAHIKLRRGSAVTHTRNLEAAIFADQHPEAGWSNQNMLGKLLMHELGPNITKSITGRLHESQGRLLQGFGVVQDASSGKWELPDFELAGKATDADLSAHYQTQHAGRVPTADELTLLRTKRDQHAAAAKKIISTAQLNEKIFTTIITNDQMFTGDQLKEFERQYNAFVGDDGVVVPTALPRHPQRLAPVPPTGMNATRAASGKPVLKNVRLEIP